MNANDFRKRALALPEAVEQEHHAHPDFRVKNKVFATLGPEGDWAMVKLRPDQQDSYVKLEPKVYAPINGAWGKRGCTRVELKAAKVRSVSEALLAAWRNTAPKRLIAEYDAQ